MLSLFILFFIFTVYRTFATKDCSANPGNGLFFLQSGGCVNLGGSSVMVTIADGNSQEEIMEGPVRIN